MSQEPIELSALRSRGRRCPWYQDAMDLAARPRAPYERWGGVALVFAGSQSWEMAADVRNSGRRAVTVLPPGADPVAMRWPPVLHWIGDCGDLDSGAVVQLVRVLVSAGALKVSLVARSVDGGFVNCRVES